MHASVPGASEQGRGLSCDMLPGLVTDPLANVLPLVLLGIAAAVLAWDVTLAGWIAARREAPVVFTQLTGFCGLLVVPAVVVAIASGTVGGARTIVGITWLVPAVAIAFALQVAFALASRLVSPLVGLPLLVYDIVLAAVACGDYLLLTRGTAPLPLQAALSARDVLVGIGVGRAALVSPLAILVPILAPAYPARWRWSGATRGALVLAATALATVLVLEWPRGVAAIRSYDVALSETMPARNRSDFAVGLEVLPTLTGAPPARAWAADTMLVHTLAPDLVMVTLHEDATRGAALDSLARTLATLRADSVRLAVALAFPSSTSEAAVAARLAAVERIVTRLRPDVLVPALPEPVPDWVADVPATPAWWTRLLQRSAQAIARVEAAERARRARELVPPVPREVPVRPPVPRMDSLRDSVGDTRVDTGVGDTLSADTTRARSRIGDTTRADTIRASARRDTTVDVAAAVDAMAPLAPATTERERRERTTERTTRLMWVAARLDVTDSIVYAWAVTRDSPVDIVGASIFPSFSGLPAIDARLRALERWRGRAALSPTVAHWLVPVGGLPRAHGDISQVAALRHILAWGARRPWIGAVVIGEPADYARWLGLRASNGRYRQAVAAIGHLVGGR